MWLCEKVEHLSIKYGDSETSLDLSQSLRQFRRGHYTPCYVLYRMGGFQSWWPHKKNQHGILFNLELCSPLAVSHDFVRWMPFTTGLNGPPSWRLVSFHKCPLPWKGVCKTITGSSRLVPSISGSIHCLSCCLSTTDVSDHPQGRRHPMCMQPQLISGGRLCMLCRLQRTELVTLCMIEKFCGFAMYSFIPSSYLYSITASLIL